MNSTHTNKLKVLGAILALQSLSACGPVAKTAAGHLSSYDPAVGGGNISIASVTSPAAAGGGAATAAASTVNSPSAETAAPLSAAQRTILRRWSTLRAQPVFLPAGETPPTGTLLEGAAFATYQDGGGERRLLYSCEANSAPFSNFLSLDARCEGHRSVGSLGYVEPNQKGDSSLLVRCFHPVRGQHLAVLNANVGECLNQGYKMEVALGWVPNFLPALSPVRLINVFRGYHPGKNNHTWEHSALLVQTLGYQSEGSVFKMFAYESAERLALFLCHAPAPQFAGQGSYFISTFANCEGMKFGKFLGYASRKATAETPAALIRCLGGPNGGHLITAGTADECTRNGFKVETTLGYVAL